MRCSPTLHAAQKRIDWAQFGLQSKVLLDMKSCDMCPTGRKLYLLYCFVLTTCRYLLLQCPLDTFLCDKKRELLPFVNGI